MTDAATAETMDSDRGLPVMGLGTALGICGEICGKRFWRVAGRTPLRGPAGVISLRRYCSNLLVRKKGLALEPSRCCHRQPPKLVKRLYRSGLARILRTHHEQE